MIIFLVRQIVDWVRKDWMLVKVGRVPCLAEALREAASKCVILRIFSIYLISLRASFLIFVTCKAMSMVAVHNAGPL